jgi:hypothetical protein
VLSPLTHECAAGGRLLELRNPSLSAKQLDEVLRPFLDGDLLFARDTEYRMTNSIFAPITDALDRAGLAPKEVHLCLAVGGSCLIPQVQAALRGHVPKARLLTYDDPDAIQTAVARGAALHALALALTGHGFVRPISHDVISLRTSRGVVALVPKGVELPFPGAESAKRVTGLIVPQTVSAGSGIDLRVEVVAGSGSDERVLDHRMWRLPAPIARGEALLLEVQLDENQVLDVQLALAADPEGRRFDLRIENPLTNVVNPQPARVKLDERERLRTNAVLAHEVPAAVAAARGSAKAPPRLPQLARMPARLRHPVGMATWPARWATKTVRRSSPARRPTRNRAGAGPGSTSRSTCAAAASSRRPSRRPTRRSPSRERHRTSCCAR